MIARITATAISHGALGPAPNTIGNGPMKIMPPTLDEFPPSIDAKATRITPIKMTVKPDNKIQTNFPESSIPSSPLGPFSISTRNFTSVLELELQKQQKPTRSV